MIFWHCFGLVIFASVAENLLFCYVSLRFGYKPVIIYRLITVLFTYIIPILPEIYAYYKAILRMSYPYIVFLFLENIYAPKKVIIARSTRSKRTFVAICVIAAGVLVALLVSCEFTVGIIAIGSNSMRPEIQKGDAIVFVKYTDQQLQRGDIVVFYKNNMKLVHRIIDIENVNNEFRYTTKGDNNEVPDSGYITSNVIIGISKARIKYIGYPSILLGEMFNIIKK